MPCARVFCPQGEQSGCRFQTSVPSEQRYPFGHSFAVRLRRCPGAVVWFAAHCEDLDDAHWPTAARAGLRDREAEFLTVPYFHVVYTLPAPVADLAYTNKAVIYDILFKASAASGITACSPMAVAPTTSPRRTNFVLRPRLMLGLSPKLLMRMHHVTIRARAHVAAGVCSSSKRSRADRCRDTGERRS